MTNTRRFTKDPNDRLDYGINWSAWLANDAIDSVTWIVPDGITADVQGVNGTTAIIWLSGGTAGETYLLTCRIQTTAGRTIDQTIEIACVER